ncbi:MAG: YlxR family protein [Bacilli bacterium]|jgi:predicted RNA-binding protein YlxR (DUF448 family)|nr:YlxR family protein [Bacilli bacterium]MCH4202417.1 YlxR family protein [Bacilli bacterium]MCH4235239.1 YlxR family protein [Bacilli bacterium]
MKKIPLRRCLATGEQLPKKDLLRIVKTPTGEIKIDPTGKLNGRGAYLKISLEALQMAKKKKALEKAFEMMIPEEIYGDIENYIRDRK